MEAIESTSLSQRVVLLGLVELSERGTTPVHSGDVKRACQRRLEEVEGDVVGELSEPDAIRALNELAGAGILSEAEVEDRSPVGKGRPTYALAADPEAVLDALAEDDRLTPLVEEIRTETTQ